MVPSTRPSSMTVSSGVTHRGHAISRPGSEGGAHLICASTPHTPHRAITPGSPQAAHSPDPPIVIFKTQGWRLQQVRNKRIQRNTQFLFAIEVAPYQCCEFCIESGLRRMAIGGSLNHSSKNSTRLHYSDLLDGVNKLINWVPCSIWTYLRLHCQHSSNSPNTDDTP